MCKMKLNQIAAEIVHSCKYSLFYLRKKPLFIYVSMPIYDYKSTTKTAMQRFI